MNKHYTFQEYLEKFTSIQDSYDYYFELQKEIDRLNNRITELEKCVSRKEEQITNLDDENFDLENEIERLKEEYVMLQNASDEVEEEKDREIERLKEDIGNYVKIVLHDRKQIDILHSIIKEVRAKLYDLNYKIKEIHNVPFDISEIFEIIDLLDKEE